MGHGKRTPNEESYEDARLRTVAVASYFATLVLLVLTFPLGAFPYFASPVPRAISVLGATLSLLTMSNMRGGYGFVGNVVSGALGAAAGIGALYMPTVSAASGLSEAFLPALTLVSQTVLIARAEFERSRQGRVSGVVEAGLAVVLGLMINGPLLLFMLI